MKLKLGVILVAFFALTGFDRHKPAYLLYNENGREVNYRRMMRQVKNADILLFGELHGNPISHWLQLEVTRDLFNTMDGNIMLAAEMFEADNQMILDEYIGRLISESRFEEDARLWGNYHTDYKPLVDFAREHSLPFVATNIPRRYASMVFHGGFEALDKLGEEALNYIAPLPINYDPDLPGYKAMLDMNRIGIDHANENLPKAQAIKDATMAHFINNQWIPGKILIHFHGTYHSDNFEGIYWYLKQHNPELNIITIATTTQQNPGQLDDDSLGRANYIIVVPDSMTRTF